MEKAEHRLERLVHERRPWCGQPAAEEEANELEQQITGMTAERATWSPAIGRLRQGHPELNPPREGRRALPRRFFEQVQRHFQQLFTKLFGGRQSRTAADRSADPLEAGLEIHASPPGKKLQACRCCRAASRR